MIQNAFWSEQLLVKSFSSDQLCLPESPYVLNFAAANGFFAITYLLLALHDAWRHPESGICMLSGQHVDRMLCPCQSPYQYCGTPAWLELSSGFYARCDSIVHGQLNFCHVQQRISAADVLLSQELTPLCLLYKQIMKHMLTCRQLTSINRSTQVSMTSQTLPYLIPHLSGESEVFLHPLMWLVILSM